jgi:hypothetical protein
MDGPNNILSPQLLQKVRLLSDVTVICEQGCHVVAIDDTVVNHHAIYLQSVDGKAVIAAFPCSWATLNLNARRVWNEYTIGGRHKHRRS